MTFKQWILTYNTQGLDSPVGDLAYDISRDKSFPDVDDYLAIKSHLENRGACLDALETFDTCWSFYCILYIS